MRNARWMVARAESRQARQVAVWVPGPWRESANKASCGASKAGGAICLGRAGRSRSRSKRRCVMAEMLEAGNGEVRTRGLCKDRGPKDDARAR
eukprot:1158778-Heterocapsa_arctica.AAC.1